jgi:hypothetical protein
MCELILSLLVSLNHGQPLCTTDLECEQVRVYWCSQLKCR